MKICLGYVCVRTCTQTHTHTHKLCSSGLEGRGSREGNNQFDGFEMPIEHKSTHISVVTQELREKG